MYTWTTASHTWSMLSVIALSYLICPQHVNNTYIGMDVIIEDTLLIESSMNCFILTYISLQQEQVPTCMVLQPVEEKVMKKNECLYSYDFQRNYSFSFRTRQLNKN